MDEPQLLKRNRGMRYANVNRPVELEGKSVLSDADFVKLKEAILNTKQFIYFVYFIYMTS